MKPFKTPVLLIIFNRPEETRKAFEKIKKIKPGKLYIAADGPRTGKHETEKCERTRSVVDEINWDCDLKTLFRETNLGCKKAVSGAIDWFFENEERGIIIEDDCILDPTFFPYCEELLERYADFDQVMTITAENVQPGRRTSNSYYFSKFMHCWGWASWRRAWKHYDSNMKSWPEQKKNKKLLSKVFDDNRAMKYWEKIFDNVYEEKIDTWDRQWTYAIWEQGGVNIIPEVNVVSNIGFGKSATHTRNKHSGKAKKNTQKIEMPLTHPEEIQIHKQADYYAQSSHFQTSLFKKIHEKVKGLLH